jgi:hypothetical protein
MPHADIDIPTAAIALVRKHGDQASIYPAMEGVERPPSSFGAKQTFGERLKPFPSLVLE